jgi:hypothetical protein
MAKVTEIQRQRFEMVPFDEIELSCERNYVVKGLFPREGLTVVWGAPKCGKSFWCFHVALHIALGWEYQDRRVTQAEVVYVALEGGSGFGARAEAFRLGGKLAEDHDPLPFHLINDRLDLIGEHKLLIDRIRDQLNGNDVGVIFIDTLNRSLSGSESSDEDMSSYIRASDAVREAFRCAVVIIHHCGVDSTRPRGHTSLGGAVDAQLAVKRDKGSTVVTVAVEWMKDGVEGDVIACKLEPIEVGVDEDGDAITSCIVVEAEAPTKSTSPLTPKQRGGMDALKNVLADHGNRAPNSKDYPSDAIVVDVNLWREHLFSIGILDREASNPRRDFFNLKNQLYGKDAIRELNGHIWAVKNDN